jgi:hypothetical protein
MTGILLLVFGLCPQFVGQPFQQSSEWIGIFLEIVGALVVGFIQGEGLGSLRLGKVGGVFRNLSESWI